jgi:hypothetical protein
MPGTIPEKWPADRDAHETAAAGIDAVAKVPGRRVPAKPATEPKNEKPDKKRLNRTEISASVKVIRDPPQAVNPAPRRRHGKKMLATPVDSRAFAMYQSGPVEKMS